LTDPLAVEKPLREFLTDPTLTVACVLFVVVSVGWIVVWRQIKRDMRRAAVRSRRLEPRNVRDIWAEPPPP
jgi:hypothetical protein